MDEHVTVALAQNSAVRAFEDLRGEVSLLRRAVEGLAAERRDLPDYGPTLEALASSNEEIRQWAKAINARPGIQLTPEHISEQIGAASRFRQQDRQELAAAQRRLETAIAKVTAISDQARTTHEQVRWTKIVGCVCFLGGYILWPLLAQITVIWH